MQLPGFYTSEPPLMNNLFGWDPSRVLLLSALVRGEGNSNSSNQRGSNSTRMLAKRFDLRTNR